MSLERPMAATKEDCFTSISTPEMAFVEYSFLCGLCDLLFKEVLSFEQKVAKAAKRNQGQTVAEPIGRLTAACQ